MKDIQKVEQKKRCEKHGSPMISVSDAFSFVEWFECRACGAEKTANSFLRNAEKARDIGNMQKYMSLSDRAANKFAEAKLLAGRWFECKVDGEGWEMSEPQIELARSEGKEVEVLSEVV